MIQEAPTIRPFNGDNIPDTLKANPRWAPWRAVWNEKRQKFDKIPAHAKAPYYGISTAKPERWYSYAQALKAYQDNPTLFAGVGYVMTGQHDVVGVDLDRCVADNTIAPWAQEVIDRLASYTELSPSGNGLRILVSGEIPNDWTNHEVGIEVYGGNEPRFLTVTGQRLKVSPHEVQRPAPSVLEGLSAQYAKSKTTATIISLELPDILDEMLLPNLGELGIHHAARDFLTDGSHRGDRSRELFSTAVALYSAGLKDDEVFSLLALNPFAFEVALDHRRQDSDRALMYLWVEHCQKGKAKSTLKASLDDFSDLTVLSPRPELHGDADDFDVVEGVSSVHIPVKPNRFAFTPGESFFDPNIPDTRWTIKRLLPETGLGMVFGPSMSGKTFFALDMAMSVALGREWRGQKVNPGQVAYICAEGGTGFRKRGLAYLNYHGVERGGLPMHLLADAPNLLERGDVKDLILSLKTIKGLKLVVVDTLAQTTPGANENASEDMGRAMSHCNKIVAATGALVLLVGHTGKDENRGHRGWSGMPAAFDVSIQLERNGDYRAATIVKMKDGEGEGTVYPFHLAGVELGRDEDNEAVTSCVALPGAKEVSGVSVDDDLTEKQKAVLRAAGDMADLCGEADPTDVRNAAKDSMPKPTKGKSDNRTRDVDNAYKALIALGRLVESAGTVRIFTG